MVAKENGSVEKEEEEEEEEEGCGRGWRERRVGRPWWLMRAVIMVELDGAMT